MRAWSRHTRGPPTPRGRGQGREEVAREQGRTGRNARAGGCVSGRRPLRSAPRPWGAVAAAAEGAAEAAGGSGSQHHVESAQEPVRGSGTWSGHCWSGRHFCPAEEACGCGRAPGLPRQRGSGSHFPTSLPVDLRGHGAEALLSPLTPVSPLLSSSSPWTPGFPLPLVSSSGRASMPRLPPPSLSPMLTLCLSTLLSPNARWPPCPFLTRNARKPGFSSLPPSPGQILQHWLNFA